MVLIDCTWALREAKQDLFFMCLYIMDFFILFSSCAQLNMEWNTPYGVFQRNICSDTLSLAIFPSTQAILLNFLWHCPFYCNWMICMRREGGSVSLSFLSLKWKESYTSRTFVFWIPFYYLDISELMWAMAWEFPGARLQVFFFPLPPAFLKCQRVLLQPDQKSQEHHLLGADWWCSESCSLTNVYLILFWCM